MMILILALSIISLALMWSVPYISFGVSIFTLIFAILKFRKNKSVSIITIILSLVVIVRVVVVLCLIIYAGVMIK
ncbi:MAG: hypothetical protein IJC83_03135 [Oscillospiraceae bacterium]|nr:hypothetical protein [Oscillospiraceae bacterium]